MGTTMERARIGMVSERERHGLTEAKLRELQPGERTCKVSDAGNGLYVVVSPSGSRSFRYDYRFCGRRETLTIWRHEPVARHAKRFHLVCSMDVTLEEARLLLARVEHIMSLDVSGKQVESSFDESRVGARQVAVGNGGGHEGPVITHHVLTLANGLIVSHAPSLLQLFLGRLQAASAVIQQSKATECRQFPSCLHGS